MTRQTATVSCFTWTETCTKGSGATTKPTGWASTLMRMVLSMRENGSLTSRRALALRLGWMEHTTKDISRRGRSLGAVTSCSAMARSTRASSRRMKLKGGVSINGATARFTTVSGRATKCTDAECCDGQTEKHTKEVSLTIKERDRANLRGQTDAAMLASGETESRTGVEGTFQRKE